MFGKIKGDGYIGGIVGIIYRFSSISNCYNMGTICSNGTNTTSYIGGIAGSISFQEGDSYKVENCYNTGEVLASNLNDENTIAGNIIGRHLSGTIKNCYYEINEIDGIGIHSTDDYIDDVTEVEAPDMKTEEMIEKLNGQETIYYYDEQNVNNGYPILEWQYIVLTIKQIQPKTRLSDLKVKIGTNVEEIIVYTKDKEKLEENKFVGTGMQIEFVEDDIKRVFTLIVVGDVDGDGEAKLSDITIINRYRLHKRTLEEEYLRAGDVTGEGNVDIQDIVKINRYRLHKIIEL